MSLGAFVRTRYGAGWRTRAALEAHQRAGFARFRAKVMPRSPFYAAHADRPLQDLPPMNKARLMQSFSRINTCGIAYDEALHVALKAEHSRDFSPTIGDVSVGLSTGTSGQRGLFLATPQERRLWAAILMGRFWPLLAIKHWRKRTRQPMLKCWLFGRLVPVWALNGCQKAARFM